MTPVLRFPEELRRPVRYWPMIVSGLLAVNVLGVVLVVLPAVREMRQATEELRAAREAVRGIEAAKRDVADLRAVEADLKARATALAIKMDTVQRKVYRERNSEDAVER